MSKANHPWVSSFAVAIVERKKHLILIESVADSMVTGIDHLQFPCPKTPRIDVPIDSVCAVLGPNPKMGNVFGVKVQRYRREVSSPNFEAVHIWRAMKKAEFQALDTAAHAVKSKFKKMGVAINWPIELHIREAEGKYQGSYQCRNGVDEDEKPLSDIMTFKPQSFDDEQATKFLLAHEFGHGIFSRHMKRSGRARWIQTYLKFVELSRIQMSHVEGVKVAVERNKPTSVAEIYGLFSDEDEDGAELIMAVDSILGHIMSNYNLKKSYIEQLLAAELPITQMFPTHPIDVGDLTEMVTDYAKVSPEEFFCEVLACHVVGMTLPESLTTLLEKTL